jgi:hypothetical protein
MSSSDVARSERVLARIGSQVGLTETGRDWLIAAVDPFHDTPLNVTGYPDVNEASSVMQCVKLSAVLACPSTITGNWDCHIHNFPWLTPTTQLLCSDNVNGLNPGIPQVTSGSQWGGLAIDIVPAGGYTFHFNDTSITTPFANSIAPYTTSEFRVIGMGFEVINTTSELNIQGLVTSYRQPMSSLDSGSAKAIYATSSNATLDTFVFGNLETVVTTAPPDSASAAMLLDGSRQWKAKDGGYCVSTLNSPEIPAGTNNVSVISRLLPQDVQSGAGPNASGVSVPAPVFTSPLLVTGTNGLSAQFTFLGSMRTNLLPFNHSGLYFTGLSNSTTLQVNVIYYIERFPTTTDTDLVVIAKPSCRADDVAIELYSEVIRMMPTGVPQKMNGLGEWFADAVSAAADFVSPVLSAIPHPGAQAAALAVRGVGGAAKNYGTTAPGKIYTPSGRPTVVNVPPTIKVKQRPVVIQRKKPVAKKAPQKKK